MSVGKVTEMIATAMSLTLSAAAAQKPQTQTQTPPLSTVTETVIVTAREATIIANAINSMRDRLGPDYQTLEHRAADLAKQLSPRGGTTPR